MNTEAAGFVVQIDDDDDEDDDFLSQIAAVEAQALANKRRRIGTTTTSPNAVVSVSARANPKVSSDDDGGLYTAALKGSQSAFSEPSQRGGLGRGRVGVVAAAGSDGVSAGNACFKCGKSGHWARDCDAPGGGGGAGYNGNYGGDASSGISFPEKSCPCGSGPCLVLTANTEKNRGRKFYKCPLRQESGGCGFFEWCDNAPGVNAVAGTGSGSFSRTQNYASDTSFPALECPCGGGPCRILTAKTGKNIGSQFYRCPASERSSCGFFKWCNEPTVAAGGSPGAHTPKVIYRSSEANNQGSYGVRTGSSCGSSEANNQGSYGVRTGSSCYECGKEGHWARDCSVPSNNAPAEFGGRSATTSTCYKCSKLGHWARDCPSG